MSTTPTEDAALLAAFASAGDSHSPKAENTRRMAFRAVVERYQESVFRLSFHLTNNAEEAEDIAQETFVAAYGTLAKLRPGSSIEAWLTSIAVNRARDYLKSHRHAKTDLAAPEDLPQLTDGELDPEEAASAIQREKLLREAIEHLPAAYRTVIVLRDIEDKSYEEIRQILPLPLTTLKMRVIRGRLLLRKYLEGRL